jgi:hypothetical protein
MTDFDDRKGQICTKCGVGNYQETSIHDDWDGVLHCTNKECNHEVGRYKSNDNPPLKPEKVGLSSSAQAVLDAAINVAESPDAEAIAAATLRAAADQVAPSDAMEPRNNISMAIECQRIRDELLAIADELEAQ